MSNENPGKRIGWQEKLEKLDQFPGTPFVREASWGKLYGRLDGRKRKPLGWLWMAAAVLFLILLAFLVPLTKKTSKQGTIAVENRSKLPSQDVPPAMKYGFEKKETALLPTVRQRASTDETRKQKTSALVAAKVVPLTQVIVDPVQYLASTPLVEIEKAPALTSIVPPKRKLDVVHINELGDEQITPATMARKSPKYFEMEFGRGEIVAGHSIPFRSGGVTIITTKPPSN